MVERLLQSQGRATVGSVRQQFGKSAPQRARAKAQLDPLQRAHCQTLPQKSNDREMGSVVRVSSVTEAAVVALDLRTQVSAQDKERNPRLPLPPVAPGWRHRVYTQSHGNQKSLRHRSKPTGGGASIDRKSTRLNSSHLGISYAVF